MNSSPNSSDDQATPPTKGAVILLLSTIADTTWRMFVPALTGIIGGYALDNMLGTWPWIFAAGAILGCLVAGLLVTKQLRKKI